MWQILFIPLAVWGLVACPKPHQHEFPAMRGVFTPGIYQPKEEPKTIHEYGYEPKENLP